MSAPHPHMCTVLVVIECEHSCVLPAFRKHPSSGELANTLLKELTSWVGSLFEVWMNLFEINHSCQVNAEQNQPPPPVMEDIADFLASEKCDEMFAKQGGKWPVLSSLLPSLVPCSSLACSTHLVALVIQPWELAKWLFMCLCYSHRQPRHGSVFSRSNKSSAGLCV